jgi:hypothetical protein
MTSVSQTKILCSLPCVSSYIDLLHQMCLFNHSTDLIWHCNDPEIRQLNMRGAEYKEYCNYCHKAVERGEIQESGFCKRCRQRVALCFVCEQPVKGVYVWCPGCGMCYSMILILRRLFIQTNTKSLHCLKRAWRSPRTRIRMVWRKFNMEPILS